MRRWRFENYKSGISIYSSKDEARKTPPNNQNTLQP